MCEPVFLLQTQWPTNVSVLVMKLLEIKPVKSIFRSPPSKKLGLPPLLGPPTLKVRSPLLALGPRGPKKRQKRGGGGHKKKPLGRGKFLVTQITPTNPAEFGAGDAE